MRDTEGKIYWRGSTAEGSQNGGSYWIRFSRFGKDVRLSAKTHLKSEARKMLRRELAKAQSDTWIEPRDRKITISVLINDLQSWYKARNKTRAAADADSRWKLHLSQVFANVPAHVLNPVMLDEYRAARLAQEDKPAPATVNRELQVLRHAYKIALKNRKVSTVPAFELPREDNARMEFFTAEQVDKIRAAADIEGYEWRVFIELAYAFGWRRGELLSLRVCSFDLLAGTMRIETSKNGEAREVVLTDKMKTIVQPLLANRDSNAPLFSFDEDSFRYPWRRIAKAAGVKLFHSFRRTSARDKRAAGVDASIIMEEQGWKSESLFRRYAICAREDKERSQQKFEEFQMETRTKAAQNQMAQPQATKQVQ